MTSPSSYTLIDPQTGHLAFKLQQFEDNSCFDHLQRQNYYSLVWIQEGHATLKADFADYSLQPGAICSFAPYQPYMLLAGEPLKGIAIYFHPDFFCILKHHKEVSCNGVLYNNIFQPPFVYADEKTAAVLSLNCEQIKTEMQQPALAQQELLIAYLKIILINTVRLKKDQQSEHTAAAGSKEPFILQQLKDTIEENFKTKHSPADYASLLHISPKALAKLTKTHFNKTLSSLINERIIIEAKRELYLTNKPVKQIAWELGYDDEYYFSRFFKVNADVSPQLYRDTVGYARAMA
jgi:AraC-like DNA-binding protein